MKQLAAIALLCLPTGLSGEERCSASRVNRDEVARVVNARPAVGRVALPRAQKILLPPAWQRLLLVEPQIL